MAAVTTITPLRWCAAATGSCRSIFMCPACRRAPRRCSTASCNCRTRSVVPAQSRAERSIHKVFSENGMSSRTETLASRVTARFAQEMRAIPALLGDVSFEVDAAQLLAVCRELRNDPQFGFEQLIDLAGVDYLDYGRAEWNTLASTATGFSRGVNRIKEMVPETRPNRFAVTYQLLSVANNWRLRLRS